MTDEGKGQAGGIEGDNLPIPAELEGALQGLPAPLKFTAWRAFSRLLGGIGGYMAA